MNFIDTTNFLVDILDEKQRKINKNWILPINAYMHVYCYLDAYEI